MLTISAAAVAPGGGYGHPGMLLFSGLGLFGTVLMAGHKKGSAKRSSVVSVALLALVITGMTFAVACGSSSANHTTNGQATLTITGTSGRVSHSLPVSVTIH
jgi:hypothetical protein